MNAHTDQLEQTDEDILSCMVSDEALEIAAAGSTPVITVGFTYQGPKEVPCQGCG